MFYSVYCEPIVKKCSECGEQYRTYIPGTSCQLPCGGIVMYDDPQFLCPECDPNSYGLFTNEDLFPHMCVQSTEEITTDDHEN